MYSTAESTSSGPVGNPQGKKILLEYDINLFTYKNLEKKVPRQSWLYGYGEGAANIRKADWNQLFCRIGNDTGGKRHEAGQGIYFTG